MLAHALKMIGAVRISHRVAEGRRRMRTGTDYQNRFLIISCDSARRLVMSAGGFEPQDSGLSRPKWDRREFSGSLPQHLRFGFPKGCTGSNLDL